MIIEGVELRGLRLSRFTYLSSLTPTTINGDARRRGIILCTRDPHVTSMSAWTVNVKRPITVGGPVINQVIGTVNEQFPNLYLDVSDIGLLIQESLTFISDPAGQDASLWEFFFYP